MHNWRTNPREIVWVWNNKEFKINEFELAGCNCSTLILLRRLKAVMKATYWWVDFGRAIICFFRTEYQKTPEEGAPFWSDRNACWKSFKDTRTVLICVCIYYSSFIHYSSPHCKETLLCLTVTLFSHLLVWNRELDRHLWIVSPIFHLSG